MRKLSVMVTVVILSLMLVACGGENVNNDTEISADSGVVSSDNVEPVVEKEEVVPREYKSALRSAESYISFMNFSEKGLYEQLTSRHGDGYPADAAQYAIDNIKVDYNRQALGAAKSYLELMPMSDQQLFDQLTSEYGDGYTSSQARYAIDNLP